MSSPDQRPPSYAPPDADRRIENAQRIPEDERGADACDVSGYPGGGCG